MNKKTKIIVGMLISEAFNVKPIEYFISLYVVYMELVSIAENCNKLGVPMPDKIKEKINIAKAIENRRMNSNV